MSILGAFVAYPALALLPAAIFGLLAYRTRRRAAWIAAVVWLLYAGYETAMARRILCSGECNIRVDLLLLYPILLVLSLVAVVALVRRRRA
jgi:fructose-specific phosphotransferase system IIC component